MHFKYKLFETLGGLHISIQSNPLIVGSYELLDTILDSEIGDYEDVLPCIDNVLKGKDELAHCGGEMTFADFDKEKTVVYMDERMHTDATCELPTWLFREIVATWLKEVKAYNKVHRK